jgi:aspartyl-tRNA(Asn)/glutamyl-tRNA(Gln) amidotransferase subunit A
MSQLLNSSIAELHTKLVDGEITSSELTKQFLEQIHARNDSLGAYLAIDDQVAMQMAEEADRRLNAGDKVSSVTGIPLGIKDVLTQKDSTTSCGSRILEGFKPSYDATVLARLREAGAVFLGRCNMDEFAMGSSNENSGFFPARNPWDRDRIPGGSSGGSAAAVAGRLATAALGSDTGGSVRQPAAVTNLVGLKPTYGRVSRFGLVAFASSLDSIGPLTHTVEDAAIMLHFLAGHDPKDSTSLDATVPDYRQALGKDIKGMRLGIIKNIDMSSLHPDMSARFEKSVDLLKELGAEIKFISIDAYEYAIPTYYIIASAEASSNLARFDGIRYGLSKPSQEGLLQSYIDTRSAGFGEEVKRRVMLGTFVLSSGYYDAYYRKGNLVRALLKKNLEKAFSEVDLLISPTTPGPAWKIGELVDDPIQNYLADIFTVAASLAGAPAISIPAGLTDDGLPLGFQFIAPRLKEDRLFQAASALEHQLAIPRIDPMASA